MKQNRTDTSLTPDSFSGFLSLAHRAASSLDDHKRVELIFFDAGGGHRASAMALSRVIDQQRRPWQVAVSNLRDVLEPADLLRTFTRVRAEDFYNGLLKYDLTITVGPMLPILHALVRRIHSRAVAHLARHWCNSRPNLVVSMIPHFNRELLDGLRAADHAEGRPPTPMVTIMTDLADYPPNFWIEPQDQYVICGTSFAAGQAAQMGYSPDRILRTSGMIIRPEFYDSPELSCAEERRRLGLHPDLPTGLVMFGGYGSSRMLTIARRLAESRLRTQLIFLCGNNQRLQRKLAAMDLPFPHFIEGFTSHIPYFMRLSDYFVGKPGPGSLSEALVMGLPVIVERTVSTMVHERFNTDWILRNGFGVVLRSFAEIAQAVAAMLDRAQMAHFRRQVSAYRNRAVFEIPGLLESIMARHRHREHASARHDFASARDASHQPSA